MAEVKTNAMRMLDRAKIPYRVHMYDHADGKIDGVSVAKKLGQDVDAVYKTLVTKGAGGGCSPVGMKKLYPTVFDASVLNLSAVIVSGGRIGCQIEASPSDLLPLVKAVTAQITFD